MNTIFYFTYENEHYPYRKVFFERKWVNVATTDFENKIFINNRYPSKEAQLIDEQIIYFLKPHEITLHEKQIVEILKQNIR